MQIRRSGFGARTSEQNVPVIKIRKQKYNLQSHHVTSKYKITMINKMFFFHFTWQKDKRGNRKTLTQALKSRKTTIQGECEYSNHLNARHSKSVHSLASEL